MVIASISGHAPTDAVRKYLAQCLGREASFLFGIADITPPY